MLAIPDMMLTRFGEAAQTLERLPARAGRLHQEAMRVCRVTRAKGPQGSSQWPWLGL